jgi:hypothetical protein
MKKARQLHGILAAVMTVFLSLGITLSVSACSNTEQVIRDGLEKELAAFKDPTVESLKKAIVDLGGDESDAESLESSFSQLDTYGLKADDLLHYMFLDYDYKVGDIKVDGDKATAKVTLTSKDFASAAQELTEYFQSTEGVKEITDAYANGDQKAMYKVIFDKFFELIEAADTTTNDVTLNLTKDGDTWSVTDESNTDLVNALFSGMSDFGSATLNQSTPS